MRLPFLPISVLSFVLIFGALPLHAAVQPSEELAATLPKSETSTITPEEYQELSKKEKRKVRREIRKDLRKQLKEIRKDKTSDEETILLAVLAVLIAPLAIFIHDGDASNRFWFTFLLWVGGLILGAILNLWLLFMIPSIAYALTVILSER